LPLFIVHPVGGNVMCYIELCKWIDEDRPIYGVQQAEINEDISEQFIAHMAAHYVKEIRRIQTKGPYYLAGWSLGGVLAEEMAYQLEQQGEEIKFLGLIDSYPNLRKWVEELNQAELLLGFADDLSGRYGVTLDIDKNVFNQMNQEQQLHYIFDKVKTHHLVSMDDSFKDFCKLVFQAEQNIKAALLHHPHQVNCKITTFQVRKTMQALQNVNPWESYSKNKIQLFLLPGDHYSILAKHYAKKLAQKINKILK